MKTLAKCVLSTSVPECLRSHPSESSHFPGQGPAIYESGLLNPHPSHPQKLQGLAFAPHLPLGKPSDGALSVSSGFKAVKIGLLLMGKNMEWVVHRMV